MFTNILTSVILFDVISKYTSYKLNQYVSNKDLQLYTSYVRSLIHALITSIYALYEIYIILSTNACIFNYYSYITYIVSAISIGYFVYDTFYII